VAVVIGFGPLPPGLERHFRMVMERERWSVELQRLGHSPWASEGMILGAALTAYATGENPNDCVERMLDAARVASQCAAGQMDMPIVRGGASWRTT